MSDQPKPPLRFYVFVIDSDLEGEHVYQTVLTRQIPHRLQKFRESAYGGAMSLGRVWGKLYIPEGALDLFMEATNNTLAPEPELYTEAAPTGEHRRGCLGWLFG